MGNLTQYVSACRELGMPSQDLFEPTDLHEGKDMRAVVHNVHSLGRIAQQRGADVPTLGAKLAERNERHFSEAQLAEARAMPRRWSSNSRGMLPNANAGTSGREQASEAVGPLDRGGSPELL